MLGPVETKESKLTLHAVVVFWLKQTKQRNTKSALPQYHHKRELHLENLNFTQTARNTQSKTLVLL